MNKLAIVLSSLLATILSAGGALAQPLLASGYSEPALEFTPPVSGVLTDEFAGPELSDMWWAAVSQEQAARGASMELSSGVCVMTTERTPVGVEGSPIGLISRVGPFAPQSFTLSADMELGARQGEYGVFLAVSDLLVPGGPPAQAMGLALYHTRHAGPDGAIVTEEFILVANGASGQLGDWQTFSWPGLFDQLAAGRFSMALSYDADSQLMTVAIDALGFSHSAPASFDQPRAVNLLVGGGGGPSGPIEESYLIARVDRLASSFAYTTPAGYQAHMTPLELDQTVYDGSLIFGAPATLFLDPAASPEPIAIPADDTPVPADGTTSYAAALVSVYQNGVYAPLTVMTALAPAELAAIPGVTLHDYVPALYVAMGFGADYRIDYTALAGPVLDELEAIIVPGVGPGQSLLRKLAALRAAYDAGAYERAGVLAGGLRSEVVSQRGKHIEESVADRILALLDHLEPLLAALT